MKPHESLHFSLHFGKKKLRKLQIKTSAVGMASNFGHRSCRSWIFSYGHRTLAFGPTLGYGFLPSDTKLVVCFQQSQHTQTILLSDLKWR